MRDTVLWRKQSRIIMKLADTLRIDPEKALDLFYSTRIYLQLSDPKYGLQLMSDNYILEDLMEEIISKEQASLTHSSDESEESVIEHGTERTTYRMARRRGDEVVHQLCRRLHDVTLPPRQEGLAHRSP